MFTVKSLLDLQSLKGCKLMAGYKGLYREVKWCHIIELMDIENWINQDVIVVLTGVGINNPRYNLIDIVSSLIRKKTSGLIIAIGEFIKEVPKDVIDLANKESFPIIQIPIDLRIIDITYEIGEEIFKSKLNNNLSYSSLEVKQLANKILSSEIYTDNDLKKTLEVYLETGGNTSLSSKILYIHRNTMIYRINKIEKILQCDLRNSETRFLIRIAMD